jgi:hypothetical protein
LTDSAPAQAPPATASPSPKADLLRIDSDTYVVKLETGQEMRLLVGKDTTIFGHVKPGDTIEAWVQPDGHVRTIMIIRSGSPPAM